MQPDDSSLVSPNPQRQWMTAIGAARSENLSGVLSRLAEDSPGLLAFLYPFKPCRPETRNILAELSEILSENSDLRKLARAAGTGKPRLEGAAVVVDHLPPGRSGSPNQRWVDTLVSGTSRAQRRSRKVRVVRELGCPRKTSQPSLHPPNGASHLLPRPKTPGPQA